MTSKLDDLLPAIKSASHTGLSFDALKKRFTGKSKGSVGELREMLDSLVKKGVVRKDKDGGAEYYIAAGRSASTEKPQPVKVDGVLAAIKKAGDEGLSFVELRKRFVVKSKAGEPELREELGALRRKGAVRVLKDGAADHYFGVEHGPSLHQVRTAIVRLVRESGIQLSTEESLKAGLRSIERQFLSDALVDALQERAIVELTYGTTKCYLHHDVAAKLLSFEGRSDRKPPASRPTADSKPPSTPPAVPPGPVTLEQVLPVYRRLREEQGGFSGVRIFDLMKAMGLPKEVLHPLLLQEAKAARVTIHRSASVELPREVTDAGIRLPGFADPFVTFAVKKEK
jgi:hypothetical protein